MSFVERFMAPVAAPPATWESVTPLLQRRKKPDGTYEFRPTPSFSSPKPTGGPVKQPSALRTLSDLGSATLGSIPERIKEGWAGFVEMGLNPTPDVAAAFLGAPPRPAPNDLRKGDPGRVFGREGSVLREMREDIREERQEAADQLADVVTAGNLHPAAAAWIDSAAELGSMVVDPTNFIPSAAAVKAGSKIGEPLSFVDNFLPEVAAKTSPDLRAARKYNARFGLEDLAPDPELAARFPDATIDSKAFDLAPASPARAVERRGVSELADPEAARLNEAVRVAQESLPLAEVVPFPARPPVAALPDPLSLPLHTFQEAAPDLAPGVSRAIHREAVQGAVEAGERIRPATLDAYPELTAEVAIGRDRPRGFPPPAGDPSRPDWYAKHPSGRDEPEPPRIAFMRRDDYLAAEANRRWVTPEAAAYIHKGAVKDALERGWRVPKEITDDYPGIISDPIKRRRLEAKVATDPAKEEYADLPFAIRELAAFAAESGLHPKTLFPSLSTKTNPINPTRLKRAEPLPLPRLADGVREEDVSEAWNWLSRRYPKLAGSITEFRGFERSIKKPMSMLTGAQYDRGVIWVPAGSPLSANTLAHELTHHAQQMRRMNGLTRAESEAYAYRNGSAFTKAKLGGFDPAAAKPKGGGEAGFVKLPAGPNFLDRLFRHDGEFASFGDLKGYAFERTKSYRQEIAAGERSVKTTMREFSSAFEDDVLRNPDFAGQRPDDVLRYVTEGIEGKNDLTGIPPRLRSVAQSVRDHVDLRSEGYLALYGTDLPKSLRDAIETNHAEYFGRTFAALEDPDWPRLVDPLNPKHDPQERWRWDDSMAWAQKTRAADRAAAPYVGGRVLVDGQEATVVRVGVRAKEAVRAARNAPFAWSAAPDPEAVAAQVLRRQIADVPDLDLDLARAERGEAPMTQKFIRGERAAASVDAFFNSDARPRGADRSAMLAARKEYRRGIVDQVTEAHKDDVLVRFDQIDPATGEPVERLVTKSDVQSIGGMATWTDDDLTAYLQRLLYKDPDAFFGVGRSAVGRESRGNLKRRILQDPRVDDLPTDLATKVNDGQLSLPTAIEQAKTRDGWWSQYLAHAPGLPEELDDLLGLYRDPSMRYRTSMMRAIHDQATYKLHRDLAEKGRGTIFFDAPGAPGNFVRIGGKGPLAEMYTSPERAAVIRGTENISRQASALFSAWRKLNGSTKLAKTALNFPAGPVRNVAAWPFQLLAGGHYVAAFNPARPLKLMAYQVADKLGTKRGALARMGKRLADTVELADGTRLGERWSMHLDELMPEIEFLYRQGIFGESAGASDLRHYAGAAPAKREPGAVSAIRKGIRAPIEAGINFWAGGDDLGRHVYFRAEAHNLGWVTGQQSGLKSIPADYWNRADWREVVEEASKRTSLTTPTHSMISPGVKALRDAPVAPFPGWTAEIYRNAKEQIKLSLGDMGMLPASQLSPFQIKYAGPKLKAIGAKRLAGFISTSALASSWTAAKTWGKFALVGGLAVAMTDEDIDFPDAVRSFVYPWSRDSQLGVTEVDKSTGKVRWVDLSALIPQAAFMDSVGTILRSASDPTDDSWDAAIDAVQGLVGPFLEEEVVANAVLDWARNKQTGQSTLMKPFQMARHHELSDQGYPVYTEKAAGMTQAKQSAYHFWRSLAPGTALSGERLLRAMTEDKPEVRKLFVEMTNYDRDLEVGDELMGWMGLRFATTDVAKSMSRMASDYARNRWDAAAMYGRRLGMGADGRAHPEVVLAAKAEANQMGRANHEQLVKIVADAMRLGFTRNQLEGWMKNKAGERQIKESQLEAIFRDARRMIAGQPLRAYVPVIQ